MRTSTSTRWSVDVERAAVALSSHDAKHLLLDAGWTWRRSWEADVVWIDPIDGRRLDFGIALRSQLARPTR